MNHRLLITDAITKRQKLRGVTNALRLLNGKGDGLTGLTLDQYNNHFVIQLFNPEAQKYLAELQNYLTENFHPEYLVVKDRTNRDGRSLDKPAITPIVEKTSSKTVIFEHNLQFAIDVNDTINTGLFLDMRANRLKVGQEAKGRRVINYFAYTCSFGVYSRFLGASQVTNVDISQKALDKGKGNYELNGLIPDKIEFIKDDSLNHLKRMVKKNEKFGLIILDPPTFSRSDGKVFQIENDFVKLIELSLQLIDNKGVLFLSTNCSSITNPQIIQWVRDYSKQFKKEITSCQQLTQDIDFPGSGTMRESNLNSILVKF